MIINRGDVLYRCWINVEADLSEKSTLEICEYHARTVNKNGIYLTEKADGITWDKNFGWYPLKGIDRYNYVIRFISQEQFDKYNKGRFHKSKSAAYRSVLAEAKKAKRDAIRIYNRIEKLISKHTKQKS